VVVDQLIPGSTGADLTDTVAVAPAAGHLGHQTMTSNRVSSCPGPGDESAGPLALAYTDLLTGGEKRGPPWHGIHSDPDDGG